MQRMEDSRLRQLWWLTRELFKVRRGALIRRDVKNEGRSGDVYENTREMTICQAIFRPFLQKIPEFCDNPRQSIGIVGGKYADSP